MMWNFKIHRKYIDKLLHIRSILRIKEDLEDDICKYLSQHGLKCNTIRSVCIMSKKVDFSTKLTSKLKRISDSIFEYVIPEAEYNTDDCHYIDGDRQFYFYYQRDDIWLSVVASIHDRHMSDIKIQNWIKEHRV